MKLCSSLISIFLLVRKAATQTLFETHVDQSSDDAEEATSDGEVFLDSSDLELGADDYEGDQTVGLRFRNVLVPGGATIVSAYLEFTVDETTSTQTSVTIWGEDSSNPSTFTDSSHDISSRPLTVESTTWEDISSWDSIDSAVQSPSVAGIVQELVSKPSWSSGNPMVFILHGSGQRIANSYDGAGSSLAPLLRIVYSTQAPVSPPTDPPGVITVFETRVTQWNDDAEESEQTGSVILDSSDLEFINDEYVGDQSVGIRFQNVQIPQSSSVVNAYVEFTVDEISITTTSLQIYGQDADDASIFSASTNNISNRPLTSASLEWNNIPAWTNVGAKIPSPNLSAVVQEIVDRSGWSTGNSMVFVFQGSGQRVAESFDKTGSVGAPLLHVEYLDAGPPATPMPTLPPTPGPTIAPTAVPTAVPTTAAPTPVPTGVPTSSPSPGPTSSPTQSPTSAATPAPTEVSTTIELQLQVSSGSDDAEEATSDGQVSLDSSDLELVEDEFEGPQLVGLRFTNVDVPAGAAILSATLEFAVDETTSSSTSLIIRGQDDSNAPTFSSATNDISSRLLTTASADWNNVGSWNEADEYHPSPDISTIVQEIVDSSGWLSGNAMVFVLGGSGQRIAHSYDGEPTLSPKLKISYSIGPVSTPVPTPVPSRAPTSAPTSGNNGPLPPTTSSVSVTAWNDDAEEATPSGQVSLDSSDLELVEDDYEGTQVVGIRFQNVAAPQGAVINAAYLDFFVDEPTSTGGVSLLIHGQDSSDADTFSSTNGDISNRPLTSASAVWSDVPAWPTEDAIHSSPNVGSIVQEIVSHSGWSAGNSMVFIVSGSGQRIAHSFDGAGSTFAPRLRIEYVPTCSDDVFNGEETGIDCGGPYCTPCGGGEDPIPVGQTGSWTLMFRDEFDSTEVDQSKWERGWFSNTGYSRPVNTFEEGCYNPSQVSVSGGNLELTAVAHSHPECLKKDGSPASYVSGLVNSREFFTFSYGYTEARVWLPSDSGGLQNWPAVWHTGFDHPATGEIDIMEGLSPRQPCASYHWGTDADPQSVTSCANWGDPGGWHVFAAKWEPGIITYYYDGIEFFVHAEGVVGSPHYLILNYAINVNYGVDVPSTMLVDYVRVWSLPP